MSLESARNRSSSLIPNAYGFIQTTICDTSECTARQRDKVIDSVHVVHFESQNFFAACWIPNLNYIVDPASGDLHTYPLASGRPLN